MSSKVTAIILLAACLQVSARTLSQNVTLKVTKGSLESTVKKVATQAGYRFFYQQAQIKEAKPVSVDFRGLDIKAALDKIFERQPFSYSIANRTIVVIEKPKQTNSPHSLMAIFQPMAQDLRIHVTDTAGNPVSDATVIVKSTRTGGQTGADGNLTLSGIDGRDTLIISYVGYETAMVAIQHRSLVNVVLHYSISELDAMQIIGYGTTTKRFNVGNVSTISAEDIARQPVTNVLEALQGNVPGLFITRSNGLPGSQMGISIREQKSITSGKQPLFIIDGVPFMESPINTLGGSTYGAQGAAGLIDPMNSINPADIAHISVLKDADATAIYGSRGANGVILITTKKGQAGETRFDLNAYTGASTVGHYVPLLDLKEYLQMRNTAFANDKITPDNSNAPDLTLWDTTKSTDFLKKYIGNTAHQTELGGTLSGGTKYLNYRFSNTLHHESTVFPGDWGYNRFSSHLSVNNRSRNDKFTLAVTALYTKESNNQVAADFTSLALVLPPNYPVFNQDGSLNWTGGYTNPNSYMLQTSKFKSDNLLANATLGYTILKGLDAKVSLGYNKIAQTLENFLPKRSTNPNNGPGVSSANYSNSYVESYIIEPQLSYTKMLGHGKLSVLVGGTWQQSNYAQPYYVNASGFSNEKLMTSWTAASSIDFKTSSYTEYKYVSAFGRLNYILKERYLFNLTGRRDGSSRFGPGRQFGNFGSVGAGWIFSTEPWIKQSAPWLSFGKLRASYGSIGNDQIRDYGYLASYGNTIYNYGQSGVYPLRSANPDYGWESNRKLDIGLETGLFKDRILLTAAWFSSRTGNQLVNVPLSSQSGFTYFVGNMPALLESSGWEFELKTTNIKHPGLVWNSSFNITIPRNKLISFPGLATTSYAYVFIEGKPIDNYFGYRYTGLKEGIATVKDLNGDGEITSTIFQTMGGDYDFLNTSSPKLYGGLSNSLTIGRFQIDLFLQFVKQQKYNIRSSIQSQPGGLSNQDAAILSDGFKPSATSGSEATFAYQNYYLNSDAILDDASFIRLKNLSFSYKLPTSWMKAARFKEATVFVRGQNLLTLTSYYGFDPETAGSSLPPLRQIVAGINCSL